MVVTTVADLREIVTKSAQDTLKAFKEILCGIDDRCSVTDCEKSRAILIHIVATMSYKAGMEKKFDELLEEYRRDILSPTVDNYEYVSEDDQQAVGKLSNFLCGVHRLVHMTNAASATLLEAERFFFGDDPPIHDKRFVNDSEPGASRLTACKVAAKGGDEKSGCHGPFSVHIQSFLKQNVLKAISLQPHTCHRFNILFSNATKLFFLSNQSTQFLKHFESHQATEGCLS